MSAPPGNDRLLRALLRQPVDRTPVWIMRQAGRYLPEYRAVRAKAGSFMALCTNPELACEVTLQPLLRYQLDAAILFSDILVIPHAMGVGLSFAEGEGPRIARPIRSEAEVLALPVPDPEDKLRFVIDAIGLIRRELAGRVPLIGFAGSPWTVATYMVEGGSSKDFPRIRGLLQSEPRTLHALLEKLARATTAYLNAQIAAGVQAVMIFDTWGGALSTPDYLEFSLAYMQQILAGLAREPEGRRVPVILFTKGGGIWLARMAATGADALGIDSATELAAARKATGDRVALQGNLDPRLLHEPPDWIRHEVARVLESYGRGPGHVFNLGHGVQPETNPEHVAAMIAAVHELSPAYHR
ncbi:MAG: uroporphyrinogen decarboxylase [Gammaproteobacteria bacterium]|nr:uroporphyrinogen decarboxylase [Gammaproteobacteria bacterium]